MVADEVLPSHIELRILNCGRQKKYKFNKDNDSNKYKLSLNSCSAIDRFYSNNSHRRVHYRFGRGRVRKIHTKRYANRRGGESNPATFWSLPAGDGTSFCKPAL